MSNSVLGLEGKVAVITGASQGVGLGCARQFVQVGADVVITGRRAEPLEKAAAELRSAGREVLPVVGDAEDPKDVAQLVAATKKRFGRVDILVNNVGGRRGKPEGTLLESGPEYWRGRAAGSPWWTAPGWWRRCGRRRRPPAPRRWR